MDNRRELVYLAALLHDIGKFYQRADKRLKDKDSDLSEYSKKMANEICFINGDGGFGYQHVVWTNEFIEEFKSKFEEIPGIKQNICKDGNSGGDCLVDIACNHHSPKSQLQGMVTLADWWSSGVDRCSDNEFENEKPDDTIKWGSDRYRQIPLYSIFNGINGGHGNSAFLLNRLSLEEEKFFPKEIIQKGDGVGVGRYAELWNQFTSEFEKLPTESFSGFVESLLYLLKKIVWCVPTNTNVMANISLFDHLKTTAAFADCFYQYELKKPNSFQWDPTDNKLSLKNGEKPVLLVGGDLSGIQKFIYNIASQKAAISLKGRSFYLQLLIDSVIQRIISHKDINATMGQVVYSSGGKFYMLLPNTDEVKQALSELKESFEKELWKKHYGQLILNMDYIPFAYSASTRDICFGTVENGTIGDLWKCLADKLTENKNHKFKSILLSDFDQLFDPQPVKAEAQVCAVTGIEEKCEKLNEGEEYKPTYVLPIVKEQSKLGSALKDADYIITYKSDKASRHLSNRSKFEIEIVNTFNYLFDKKELADDKADFREIASTDVCRVKMINQLNFLDAQIKGQKVGYGFQFYGGSIQAQIVDKKTNELRNKTFDELSDGTYLGVLRMDVDGLGSIFIKGLPSETKNFSAYSTLSFMLDYFFSGYLNTIREMFKDDVNVLYSGGDDIFAVGKWDKLILFAEKVRKDFARFVGREDISISGGIVIVGDKYPIAKAAELAGNAEDAAKKFNGGEKNAFNLFGENISWKTEFEFVKGIKVKFFDLCKDEKMPRSILHRIIILRKAMGEGNLSYIWHTAYFLTRFSEGKNDAIKEFCCRLQILLCDKRNFELIALAARWAELELRFIGNKNINN
jgi:CRISPR-associated protein Csm1